MKHFLCLVGALLCTTLPQATQAQEVAIHAGTLIDGESRTPRHRVTIVVRDARIVSVEPGFTQPKGARIIDLSTKTVLPGLIDTHVHLMMDITEYPGLLPKATRSSYDDLLAATVHARVTLEAGFTTVRDLGGATSAIVALKQAIANGVIPGPRMWVSGDALGPTGGHSDKRNGFDPALSKDAWTAGVVDGPLEMARKVRSLHAQGATAIKIMPSGGVSSVGDDPNALLMTDEEIGAAVRTAHILHMRVAAHAHGADAIRRASELGVDSIEHGSFAGTDAYRVMRAKGTFMSPTLTAGLSISDFAREHPGKLEKSVEAKALAIGPIMSRNAGDAFRAGVKLSFGTDAGVFPHGQNAREFALLVKAGVPPTDAILSATSAAAALLDAGADIGTVKAGRFADLIATDTNPLDDITALERVTFVMKGGTVVKSGM